MIDYLPAEQQPKREEVDRMTGPVLVEFGTEWCGHCIALAPHVKSLVAQHPEIRHIKVMDGPGLPLGRSFRVKLWPNLVFMRDGAVLRQLARPGAPDLREAFAALTAAPSAP